MKRWLLTCSTDADKIDWTTTIESDTEPDFWTCYDLAAAHGCPFFDITEIEPAPLDLSDDCTGCEYLSQCRAGDRPPCPWETT